VDADRQILPPGGHAGPGAGAGWLWWISAAVFRAGPVLLPFLLGLALAIAAGVRLWTSTERPATESAE
jgi:hypothetical protein